MTRSVAVAHAADYFDSGAFLADLQRRDDVFTDDLGVPTIWVPHSYPACAQHAPDEHLLAPLAREALHLMAALFWDLGEHPSPGHRTAQ